MSSPDEIIAQVPAVRKRKLQRACDYCRSKKVKCDGPKMPDRRCSNCTTRRIECGYIGEYNSGYPKRYVEALESRLKRMEQLVGTLCPTTDLPDKLDSRRFENDFALAGPSAYQRSHSSMSHSAYPATSSTLNITPPTPPSADDSTSWSDQEEEEALEKELADDMRKLSMQPQPSRYHGKSSSLVIIRSAMALKTAYTGSQPPPRSDTHQPWLKLFVDDGFPVFEESSFPPPDLLDVLVDLYFHNISCHYPLLHEPTLKSSIAAGEHLRHGSFGATVLLVCAIASRFTRDPRVLLDDSSHPHSAGWKWFNLVEGVRRLSFSPAKLHNLQVYALMAIFLQGSTAPQSTWPAIGAGIRAALDVGAHRRKMYASTPTVEDELWRRAFWVLVVMEWTIGYALGRPSSIHDEDFDLALPTECDDESWLTPEGEPLFEQPQGKPSKVTAFVYMIRLGQILSFAMRTVYSSNKSKAQLGNSDQQWEQRLVAELDSGLNKWTDSLPSHLRWDPEQEDVVFLTQAASLKAFYYFCQTAVHRAVLSSHRESALSLPSTIICTNAARSSIQVLDALYKRTGSPTCKNMGMLFLSGMVLMTNAFAAKRSDRVVNVEKDVALARKAVEMMHSLQYESHASGSLAGLLNDLISAFDDPHPGVRMSANVRAVGTSAQTTEAGRPSSSAAFAPETLPRVQCTEFEDSDSSWRSARPHDMTDTEPATGCAGHFFPPLESSNPSARDFLQPDTTPLFNFPFGSSPSSSDGLAPMPNAERFAAPFSGFAQQSVLQGRDRDHVPQASALPEYGFLPRYAPGSGPPAQSRAFRPASASADPGMHGVRGQHQHQHQAQFDIARGHAGMFALPTEDSGPMDYHTYTDTRSASARSSVSSGSFTTQAPGGPHQRHLQVGGSAGMGAGAGAGDMDMGIPHFGLVDDALAMWPHFPPPAGWADWGTQGGTFHAGA